MINHKVLSAITLLGVVSVSHADSSDTWPSYDHHMMWGYSSFGGIGILVFWLVVIVFAVFLIKLISGSGRPTNSSDALERLKQRFAEGEIDEEEYRRRKKVLKER